MALRRGPHRGEYGPRLRPPLGTSVAEVTRRVIDFGLQEVAAHDRLAVRAQALERARQLRKEQRERRLGRALEVDVADSIERMRDERDAAATAGRR